MKFISEEIIDKTLLRFQDEDILLRIVENLGNEQPALAQYLLSDQTSAFSEEERLYLFFLVSVIYESIKEAHPEMETLSAKDITEAEEKNYEFLAKTPKGDFYEKITPFYEQYPQEELLAFAEDATVIDEESQITTKEGREYMFVLLKSIIDAFEQKIK